MAWKEVWNQIDPYNRYFDYNVDCNLFFYPHYYIRLLNFSISVHFSDFYNKYYKNIALDSYGWVLAKQDIKNRMGKNM